ncbi:MAG TPA: PIN domain-containing protein [Chitinophagaceae bacterium]|nr:PIN domain-containing protein [Chitinophagaceae bacterium]HPH24456.1 PIN domain-containing protein [Chitinophagaceae bacterium]
MKVFLDANILVSVLNKEYPVFTYTARVLSLSEDKKFQLFSSSSCFAIAFYFSSKKSGAVVAKNKIALLAEKIKLAENKTEDLLTITNNKKILDLEDGLQYHAAKNAGCTCIVTENVKDFHFSDIEVLDAESFLIKYALSLKK